MSPSATRYAAAAPVVGGTTADKAAGRHGATIGGVARRVY
jgi:hypothetical protein